MKQSVLDSTNETLSGSSLSDSHKDLMKKQIDHALRMIHKKMIHLYNLDFTYFSDIRFLTGSEVFDWLTRQVENNFHKKLTAHERSKLKQFNRVILESQVIDHFQRLAFYDRKRDTLCISEDLLEDGIQPVIIVSIHELSEKMLSTILHPILEKQVQIFKMKSLQIDKVKDLKQIRQLFNDYLKVVFGTVFKEGFCEALSLYTLNNMKTNETSINLLEKEYKKQHSKHIGLLFDLEKTRKKIGDSETAATGQDTQYLTTQVTEGKKLVMEAIRNAHIIKGVSYYLGYPLAKAFLDKYGIKKINTALEKTPPFKAQYFAEPHTYLTLLESQLSHGYLFDEDFHQDL